MQSGKPGVAAAAPKEISPGRLAAFAVLQLVGAGRGHSDDLLHSSRLDHLSSADRGLATTLVLGILRWQISLDARIRRLLARPEAPIAAEALLALRMGAFQLLHLDRIPPHAALSESVELCRWAGQPQAAGMVNAVLRRLLQEPAPGLPLWESTAAFAERLGHPLWMVERWVRSYGREAALRICEAGGREPAQGELFAYEAGAPRDGEGAGRAGVAWDAADAELGAAVPPGAMPVMDDGSRLVAELAAAVAPETAGRAPRVWDCCAAPGGKTAVLRRRLPPGAELLATDISARRLRLTEDRLRFSGLSPIIFSVADAAQLPESYGEFDLILCDVPCSGTGTLARNPEIRHRLAPGDLSRQSDRQRVLLRAAASRLAPGGRLVYSTCSLEPEECEAVAEPTARELGLLRVPVADPIGRLAEAGILREGALPASAQRNGDLRTLPGTHPGDGFYAAILERG